MRWDPDGHAAVPGAVERLKQLARGTRSRRFPAPAQQSPGCGHATDGTVPSLPRRPSSAPAPSSSATPDRMRSIRETRRVPTAGSSFKLLGLMLLGLTLLVLVAVVVSIVVVVLVVVLDVVGLRFGRRRRLGWPGSPRAPPLPLEPRRLALLRGSLLPISHEPPPRARPASPRACARPLASPRSLGPGSARRASS